MVFAFADGAKGQRDARARKTSDELGTVDFAVATNSHEMEVKSFTATTSAQIEVIFSRSN
jgi:hypothetical protein